MMAEMRLALIMLYWVSACHMPETPLQREGCGDC